MLKTRLGAKSRAEISAARPAKISAVMKFKAMKFKARKFKSRADGFANFAVGSAFACRETPHAAFGRTWLLSAREKGRLVSAPQQLASVL